MVSPNWNVNLRKHSKHIWPKIEGQNIMLSYTLNEGNSSSMTMGTLENINSIKVCTAEKFTDSIIDDNPMLTDKRHLSYAMLKTDIENMAMLKTQIPSVDTCLNSMEEKPKHKVDPPSYSSIDPALLTPEEKIAIRRSWKARNQH